MRTICVMRDIYKAISLFEFEFEKAYGLSLNEAMVLCSLEEASGKGLTSTTIAERTEMTPSHTSKVIRMVEKKKFVKRAVGEIDKRQMYFCLTGSGRKILELLDREDIRVPELLKPVFANQLKTVIG